jgi:diadenosine tetraphosphate (Ap4A) HIT family hydrolase
MTDATDPKPCPFCTLPPERIVARNTFGGVLRDLYPVSPGHTLVIPWRHVGSFFDLTTEERAGLMELLEAAKAALDVEHRPDAYNLGLNDGPAAGQTVPHCHLHLIPRYAGDQDDPRGGVRWVIPGKAKYWL